MNRDYTAQKLLYDLTELCQEEFDFCLTDVNLSPGEEKQLKDEVVKKGFKSFTQTGLISYYMALSMKKKCASCLMTTNCISSCLPISVNVYFLNQIVYSMMIL